MIRSLFFPLMLAGGVLIALVVLQMFWAIGRLAMGQVPAPLLRLWSDRLARAIRGREPIREALLGAQGLSRRPYPFRIRRCVALLDSEQPPTLVEAMHLCQMLPHEYVQTARAAEAAGPEALAAYFAVLAQPAAPSRILPALTPYLGVLLATVVLGIFQMVYIIPKMGYIAKDLGIRLDPVLEFMVLLSRSVPWYIFAWLPTPVGMMVIALGLSVVIGWQRRWSNRTALAHLVMERVTAQATEQELANLVAKARPRQAQAILTAGENGDFAAITAACGFRAASPNHLAAALAAWQQRRERLQQVTATCARFFTPLIVAIPVALLCVGFHRTILGILYRLLSEESL